MLKKLYKFFNQSTRQAYFERVSGYVTKSYTKGEEINYIQKQYGVDELYRFDLGENVIGYSQIVYKFLLRLKVFSLEESQLSNYPEVIHERIRKRIAEQHNIEPNWLVISTGLDAILDLISRVFFDPKDYYLSLVPSFYLFEEYSERMGAIPLFIRLNENDNFSLTPQKVRELKSQIVKFKPKIVWIANPNNPTGSIIAEDTIEEIVQLAAEYNSFVVVDEAYIEYLKHIGRRSAVHLASKYNNLMILRTFSKAYGLAGMRIGYMISSSKDIIDAMLMLRTHFPVTQLALNMASLALNDRKFLKFTRKKTREFSQELFKKLDSLRSFKYIPTATNIFLLKNENLSDEGLDEKFKHYGILTSFVNFPKHEENKYLRVTVRSREDNEYLFNVCKIIDEEYVRKQLNDKKEDKRRDKSAAAFEINQEAKKMKWNQSSN